MEVHTHTHTARKKWTHYFWEFFMLFLAVTMGFLVENEREHYIERHREKKYMTTLLEDLKKDSAEINNCIKFWNQMATTIDSFRPLIKRVNEPTNREKVYRLAKEIINFDEFIYNDRTIEQLRNSGNFRLIRHEKVSDSLLIYDGYIRGQLRILENVQLDICQDLMNLQTDIFDSEIIQRFFAFYQTSDTTLTEKAYDYEIHNNKELLFKYYNLLFNYRAGIFYLLNNYNNLRGKAVSMIELLKKEYRMQ